MKVIFRYITLPFLVFGLTCILFIAALWTFPSYTIGVFLVLILWVWLKAFWNRRRNKARGWRVGHKGRDQMYYDELREGKWKRINIDGEMLVGKAHHVIYFSSIKFPEWAKSHSQEIITRIKSEFSPPGYEYSDN